VLKCGIIGIAVLDVVEGTAMAALPSMQAFLAKKPKLFRSVDQAISWTCDNLFPFQLNTTV
jgi:protein phosphatase methylesterase 1